MSAWPATLPQSPETGSYSEADSDNRIRTEMDVGQPKMRNRSTAKITTFQMTMTLTTAQVATLLTFYDTTLGGGVDAFTWKHPRTDVANSMRFVTTVSRASIGPDKYQVRFMVEELPT